MPVNSAAIIDYRIELSKADNGMISTVNKSNRPTVHTISTCTVGILCRG